MAYKMLVGYTEYGLLWKKRPKVKSISFGVPLKFRLLRFRFQFRVKSKVKASIAKDAESAAPHMAYSANWTAQSKRSERTMQKLLWALCTVYFDAVCMHSKRIPLKSKVKIRPCTWQWFLYRSRYQASISASRHNKPHTVAVCGTRCSVQRSHTYAVCASVWA